MDEKTTEELVSYLINLKFEDIPLEVIEKAKFFIVLILLVIIIVMLFPPIATWLPTLMG